MQQKQFNQLLSTILKWLDSDFVLFSKIYNKYLSEFRKKYGNDFNHYFCNMVKIWAQLPKTEYLHNLTIEEKVNKMEIQSFPFLH